MKRRWTPLDAMKSVTTQFTFFFYFGLFQAVGGFSHWHGIHIMCLPFEVFFFVLFCFFVKFGIAISGFSSEMNIVVKVPPPHRFHDSFWNECNTLVAGPAPQAGYNWHSCRSTCVKCKAWVLSHAVMVNRTIDCVFKVAVDEQHPLQLLSNLQVYCWFYCYSYGRTW